VTTPADPRLGTRLAGYQIQALLGRGGMGVVYLAEQTGPHRRVALKLLVDPATASQGFRTRFLRESELAAAIDHPNVLPVYDAGDTDGVLWIAMRHVDGIDLAALLERQGPLASEQALGIVGQVAGALDAAHARGLVHRDVKPGNVLLAVQDDAVTHAYLADFGLTKRIGGARGLTLSGQVLGTIDYIAPEQVQGGPVDGRADQYALGCVLFECLTGTCRSGVTASWPCCGPTSTIPRRGSASSARTSRPGWTRWWTGRWPRRPTTVIRRAGPWSPRPKRRWPQPPRPAYATASAVPSGVVPAAAAAGPGCRG
jgi:serine/threonine protein kinase